MEISQELREVLAKQLPAMFGAEMQAFLEKAKKDAANVINLMSQLESRAVELKITKTRLEAHEELTKREQELETQRQSLQKKELDLIKREAGIEAKIAQAELSGVKDTQKLFLANVTMRQAIVESTHCVLPGHSSSNGGYNAPSTAVPVMNTTETRSIPE